MKKLIFPSVIFMFLSAMISCKKEVIADEESGARISSQNTSNETAAVTNSTHFGALVSARTTANRITVANKFGVSYVRASTMLKDFNGKDAAVGQYISSGFKVILNLNWAAVSGPIPFPKDMVTYKQKLGAVLDVYKPEVAVIENEPTTQGYHSGPIEDYITELATAIEVCHSKGVKVADGGIHAGYVQQVMKGGKLLGKALDVQKLIDAYTTLDLDYVNVHTAGDGNSYPDGILPQVADYLRTKTGKPVMSNEFSVHSSSPSLIKSMVDEFKAGKYEYVIVRSGESKGGAVPLHSGTDLLANGIAYRDNIK